MAGSDGATARHLEVAAEFCRQVGKSNLLEYLGVAADADAAAAVEALRKKRRYMQGMQANPKYKVEAVLFIKNFGSFVEVLASPGDYLRESRRLSERTHVPVLEMTIRGALRGGAPTAEQIAWLERNASEIGVSPALFKETLDRVLRDAGLLPAGDLKGRAAGQTLGMFMFEAEERPDDPWEVLGVPRTASVAEIEDAWRDLRVTADPARLEQLDRAWRLLNDAPKTKVQRTATDPVATEPPPEPARRGFTDPGGPTDPGAPTAPPVRDRTFSPSRQGSLQSAPTAPPMGAPRQLGGEMKTLIISGATKPTFEGENPIQLQIGSKRMLHRARLVVSPNDASEVRFESSAPWAIPPHGLEANRGEHELVIELDPKRLTGTSGVATITATARGERGQLTIAVERRTSGGFMTPFVLGIVVAVVAVLLVSLLLVVASGALQ